MAPLRSICSVAMRIMETSRIHGGIGSSAHSCTNCRSDTIGFDRPAFVKPADNVGRFGNAGVGTLEGPGTSVFSMTLGKSFAAGGTTRLRFEMAFSNLFNIENLAVPGTLNITSSSFGRITGTQTVDQAGPRTIQFSLRYTW